MAQFHINSYITKPELEVSCYGCLQALCGTDKALMIVVLSIKKCGCQTLNQKLNLLWHYHFH